MSGLLKDNLSQESNIDSVLGCIEINKNHGDEMSIEPNFDQSLTNIDNHQNNSEFNNNDDMNSLFSVTIDQTKEDIKYPGYHECVRESTDQLKSQPLKVTPTIFNVPYYKKKEPKQINKRDPNTVDEVYVAKVNSTLEEQMKNEKKRRMERIKKEESKQCKVIIIHTEKVKKKRNIPNVEIKKIEAYDNTKQLFRKIESKVTPKYDKVNHDSQLFGKIESNVTPKYDEENHEPQLFRKILPNTVKEQNEEENHEPQLFRKNLLNTVKEKNEEENHAPQLFDNKIKQEYKAELKCTKQQEITEQNKKKQINEHQANVELIYKDAKYKEEQITDSAFIDQINNKHKHKTKKMKEQDIIKQTQADEELSEIELSTAKENEKNQDAQDKKSHRIRKLRKSRWLVRRKTKIHEKRHHTFQKGAFASMGFYQPGYKKFNEVIMI